jgi:hypothetical protein
MNIFTSTRFIGLLVSLIIFTLLLCITHYSPMEISEAISIIYGIYVTGRTIKGPTTKNSSTPN